MSRRIITGVLATMAAMAASAVLAQDAGPPGPPGPPPRPMPPFEAFDTDKDGRITPAEIQGLRQSAIQGLDADGDGYLTVEEIRAYEMAREQRRVNDRVARMMEERDVNGDARLSAEELFPQRGPEFAPAMMTGRMFDRMDADGDGAISRDEADKARAQMDRRRDGKRGEGRRGPRDDRGHGKHGGHPTVPPGADGRDD